MGKLSKKKLLRVIKYAPLIAIDLIIKNADEEILLGLRNNKPAQYFWFTPGGRIRKDERISQAFSRICMDELGIVCSFDEAKLIGVFEHFYTDNTGNKENFGTHYIVLAYQCLLNIDLQKMPESQHQGYRWQNIDELLNDAEVHQNTKNYFLENSVSLFEKGL